MFLLRVTLPERFETCFRAIFMPPARDWVMQLNALPNLATSARVSVKGDAS